MANLLSLVQRIACPPDNGDKLRSYRILKHLAARRRVCLGIFANDPADPRVGRLHELCADACVLFSSAMAHYVGAARAPRSAA
jgi:hypothetical protein